MAISFSTITYLIRAGRILCCRKKTKQKTEQIKTWLRKTLTLSQALDYLDNLEIRSDSKEESLSDL